jgi:pimeloyl-ACP methyl ester carboxylesterase
MDPLFSLYSLIGILFVLYLGLLYVPIPRIVRVGKQLSFDKVGNTLIDRNWLLSITWLIVIAVLSLQALIQTLVSNLEPTSKLVASIIMFILLFLSVFLALVRLVGFPDTRYLNSHKLLAHRTAFNVPHERITLYAEDGTLIKGIHLKRDHKKVVVYIHGGFRSKNCLGSVMICEWLSEYYDVFSFDLRGHGESGGFYTGDGKTILDLLAALHYVKSCGYERVGLVGRSVGAWTAVLQEARYHNVDSLVATALPYGFISDCPSLKVLWPYFVQNPIGTVIGRIARTVRFKRHIEVGRPENEVMNVSPTPLLMVFCQTDPFLGMSHEDILALYEKASEPKQLVFLEGDAHVYEINIIHKYYQTLVEWFGKTL